MPDLVLADGGLRWRVSGEPFREVGAGALLSRTSLCHRHVPRAGHLEPCEGDTDAVLASRRRALTASGKATVQGGPQARRW